MKACKACREKFLVLFAAAENSKKKPMEAFNVPFIPINSNPLIGYVQLISTRSINLSRYDQSQSIANDLCLCDIYDNEENKRYEILFAKDDSSAFSISLGNITITKSGNFISVKNTYSSFGIATFYDYDYA